jgi:hypothetical protein
MGQFLVAQLNGLLVMAFSASEAGRDGYARQQTQAGRALGRLGEFVWEQLRKT